MKHLNNKNMNKRYLLTTIILMAVLVAHACTSVIISGRVTPDGRPLMLKNRDADDVDNKVVVIKGAKYRFIGIVAAGDKERANVWSGHNEAGFAIFNTDAFNLNGKNYKPEKENDGVVMRKALETCASLKEFEALLGQLPKPMNLNSNFGVMDAEGNCAYYETSSQGYTKFDVNDPRVAPYGYLCRTNHAMTGDRSLDAGIERYMAISDLMQTAAFGGDLNRDLLLKRATRYLTNGLTKTSLYDIMPESDATPKFYPYNDYISRAYTASAMVMQGVRKGENPLLTVSYTIIGCPLTTVAVPLMLTPSGVVPSLLADNGKGYSELCHKGIVLKDQLFPMKRGNGQSYINLSRLINKQQTGILQQVQRIETPILQRGDAVIAQYREQIGSKNADKLFTDYYRWVDETIKTEYQHAFGI